MIYKWHRSLSLIIAIPVLLWAASGFMHPLMTNIRPKIATQSLIPFPVDSSRIKVSLQAALRQHHLDSIANFRLVHIDTNWFYQVQPATHYASGTVGVNSFAGNGQPASSGYPAGTANIPVYLSCTNGNALPAGDWLYAQYLARQFLEGADVNASVASSSLSTKAAHLSGALSSMKMPGLSKGTPGVSSLAGSAADIDYATPAAHDCCGAATDCVLNPVKGAKVSNVSLLKEYDPEYKSINKILPVYRVSFDRPDRIRIYVETTRDRFSFAMDKDRFVFDRIFTLVHTWGWLEFLGKGKLVVEFSLIAMAFLSTLLGIYIFFTTKTKKPKGNELLKARLLHRYTSITIALFTLMFTFSGAFHVVSKFREDTRNRFFVSPSFAADGLTFDVTRLQQLVAAPITDVSLVRMYGRSYWQITTQQRQSGRAPSQQEGVGSAAGIASPATHSGDLMKDRQVAASQVTYLQTDSPYTALPQGELKYAAWLAATFSGLAAKDVLSTEPVLRFNSEYNFADKRLPVWKVSFASNNNERYYVETSTGRLSKRVTNSSMVEEYSFAFLHKHEFLGWAGKGVKDFSTMFWALAQIVLVTVGLMLYFKYRKRRVNKRMSRSRPV